ncbi:Uncharacterised protein [uncultured archaeon]|nr:Uncharacterised protein [uncultured archaeon]
MSGHPGNRLSRQRISKKKDAGRGISWLSSSSGSLPANLRNREKFRFKFTRLRGVSATKILTPESAGLTGHEGHFNVPKGFEFPRAERLKRRAYGLNWNKIKKTPYER